MSKYSSTSGKTKEMPNVNQTNGNTPLGSSNTPWYKKKGTIIGLSSTLGAGVLTTAIAVPVVLTQSNVQINAELKKVMTVYDLANKNAKLIVGGVNLPTDTASYKVYRMPSARAQAVAPAQSLITDNIKLYAVSGSEVFLDFKDETITATSVYKVELKNTSSPEREVTSIEKDNINQPSFSITNQPVSKTILNNATPQTVELTVTVGTVSNPTADTATPTYQWEISDVNEPDKFAPISSNVDSTKSTFTYDATDLTVNTKKFFRCKISYPYVIPQISDSVSITKIVKPTIRVGTEPTSLNLKFSDITATLSVVASVENGLAGQPISYQWSSSTSSTGTFTDISGATSADYVLDNPAILTITPGTPKYFKCKMTSADADPVDSAVVSINRALAPTITITKEPVSVTIPYVTTNPVLTIEASIANGEASLMTYEWLTSDTQDGSWLIDSSATTSSYTFTSGSSITPGSQKYIKCNIGYPGLATPKSSSVVSITRTLQPVITINTQPDANIVLDHTTTTKDLTVAATVANGVDNQPLTYQWQVKDSENGRFNDITTNGTLATYSLTSVGYGFSKYYQCIIKSANADNKTSTPTHVTRLLQPLITINTQPDATTNLTAVQSSATLTVGATLAHGVANQAIAYQWQSSDNNSTNFTDIDSTTTPTATTKTLSLTDVAFGSSKYYKCKLTSANAVEKYSDVAHVARVLQPIITITSGNLVDQTLPTGTTTATAFTVTATVEHGEASGITYKWQSSSQLDSGFTDIANATSATYTPDISGLGLGVKKYFKCLVDYTGAVQKETNVAFVLKEQLANIILTDPAPQTLTSANDNFSLTVGATIDHPIDGTTYTFSYQWKKSSTQTGVYENVTGASATSATYTETLVSGTKNSFRDTWYKCEVSSTGSVPTVTSTPVLVKMELTQAEATTELSTYFATEDNAKTILTQFFDSPNVTPAKKALFYNSLHDHTFPEGVPSVRVESVTALQPTGIVPSKFPVSYKPYEIVLVTKIPANIKAKAGITTGGVYVAGMKIKFTTLFSFGNENVKFVNEDASEYTMQFAPTFTSTNGVNTSALVWTATGTPNFKKGNYPVTFTPATTDTNQEVIIDSVLTSSDLQNITSAFYSGIPTYNIKTIR